MKLIRASIGIALLMTVAIAAGCADDRASATPAPQQSQQSQQAKRTMVIPSGTSVVASLETRLSTDTNHTGDQFQASTIDAIIVDGKTVVPAGARIHGVLRDVQASGHIKGRALMMLAFEQIEDSEGQLHGISAQPLTIQAESNTKGDVEKIAAGGVLGAIIGGIVDGKKGAAIGAGAGAGAGTVVMLATQGDEVELDPGQRLNVYLTAPTSILLAAQR
jgi:outer membrane lipoprotein SlyB